MLFKCTVRVSILRRVDREMGSWGEGGKASKVGSCSCLNSKCAFWLSLTRPHWCSPRLFISWPSHTGSVVQISSCVPRLCAWCAVPLAHHLYPFPSSCLCSGLGNKLISSCVRVYTAVQEMVCWLLTKQAYVMSPPCQCQLDRFLLIQNSHGIFPCLGCVDMTGSTSLARTSSAHLNAAICSYFPRL